MKGVPLRLEIGPRDIENGKCVLVRRDNREKTVVALDNLVESTQQMLKDFAKAIYEKAKANLEGNITPAPQYPGDEGHPAKAGWLCQGHVVRRRALRR